jgi:glucose-1-phosphate cytidylyltransferase
MTSAVDGLRVVILAGGFGTRLSEETARTPKPMVEIGGRPILWHIMKNYAASGAREFVVALGYRSEAVKAYFLDYNRLDSDLTVRTATGEVVVHDAGCDDWAVHLVDTGLATNTGGRVRRLAKWLPDDRFALTYGDGLGDVDHRAVLRFHLAHGRQATITAIRPPSRFGGLELEGDRVTLFSEKPQIGEGWINGGFMVVDRAVIERIGHDDVSFEKDVLEELAADGELMAYRHEGFWQPMDTLRDVRTLEALWASGSAPWKVWS